MTQSTTASHIHGSLSVRIPQSIQIRSFFPDGRLALVTGLAAAALLATAIGAHAQGAAPAADAQAASQTAAPATTPKPDISLSNQKPAKTRKAKEEKVVESKDTKKEDKKTVKTTSLEGVDSKLPDKALYDKAEDAVKHGRFDVARLDLQTLLNTYPDSQYMMRAKLAVADSWYKEGGTAALTQAEQEYKDFITFFPNAPEAAEAQMRIGDIYFRQMDKPDRDYTNTIHAEEEYRLMLQQFPDSPLVPQARQRLREVQETLADREANIAAFYSTHANWPATIARYQTVVDTYPLYSHMDDVLISLGDAYEAEKHIVQTMRLPEAAKARLEHIYDDAASNAYRKVVLDHAAAPHVEDARDRLVGMGLPVPTPTPEQMAASVALENSRGQYTLSKRVTLMFLHQADTVQAATMGTPTLDDPKPTNAATVVKQAQADYVASFNPATPARTPLTPAPAAADDSATPAPAPASSAPLSLQEVPTASAAESSAPAIDTSVSQAAHASSGGNSMGIEIMQPPATSPTPSAAPAAPPAFPETGTAPAAAADPAKQADVNGGIGPVGPPNSTPLAPIEKPAVAPTPINDAAATRLPAAQLPPADGKKVKDDCDKSDESCSRHKKKKGLAKLNPF
jgi:outer membrane protein assembly factor BamD